MCAQVSEEELKVLLKRFVQLVAHAFYQPKEFLFIDLLVKNTILSEEVLAKRLHAEARQLRAVIHQFEKIKELYEELVNCKFELVIAMLRNYLSTYKLRTLLRESPSSSGI